MKNYTICWDPWACGMLLLGKSPLAQSFADKKNTRITTANHADIETHDRTEARPMKLAPPGPRATIDHQLAYERIDHRPYWNKLREWRHKQISAYNLIITSCEGEARKQIERYELGQVAYTTLREIFEHSDEARPSQIPRSLAFAGLCRVGRSKPESLEDSAERAQNLAIISAQNGRGMPNWMLGYLFRTSLALDESEELAFLLAEEESWATDLVIEDMMAVLREHRKEEA